MLDNLEIDNILVQYPRELEKCDLLIIPGGESTTLSMLIDRFSLREELKQYSKSFSILKLLD